MNQTVTHFCIELGEYWNDRINFPDKHIFKSRLGCIFVRVLQWSEQVNGLDSKPTRGACAGSRR